MSWAPCEPFCHHQLVFLFWVLRRSVSTVQTIIERMAQFPVRPLQHLSAHSHPATLSAAPNQQIFTESRLQSPPTLSLRWCRCTNLTLWRCRTVFMSHMQETACTSEGDLCDYIRTVRIMKRIDGFGHSFWKMLHTLFSFLMFLLLILILKTKMKIKIKTNGII